MPPHLETWPVGRQWALFSTSNGAVALANETASAVFAKLSEGIDVAAVARSAGQAWGVGEAEALRIVDGLVETWRTAGLIPSAGEPELTVQAKPEGSLAHGISRFYATSFGHFKLVCEDWYADDVMASVLSSLRSHGGDRRQVLLELRGSTNNYRVTRDNAQLCEAANISQARHEVLKQLLIDRDAPERTAALLHAGAVSIGGHAVVLPGDCGRGKSTLTACLVHAGAAYIGDDLIALEANGAWVGVFPVALSVKKGARELVRSLHGARRWSQKVAINDWEIEFVDLSDCRPAESRVPVGAIVFPHFQPGARAESVRIEPEKTLQMLLASGSRPVGPHPTMKGLCRLADKIPAYSIAYGDWRDAQRMIADLLEGSR